MLIVAAFTYLYKHATSEGMNFVDGMKSSVEMLRGYLVGLGWRAGLAFIVIYTIRPLIFFPTSILTPLAAVLFGPMSGWIYTYIGENFSAALAFWTARYFGGGASDKFNALKRFDDKVNETPLIATLFLRMVPVFPFDFVNYGLGLSKMKFRWYLTGTMIGVIPGLTAYIFLGASLMDLRFLIPTIIGFIVLFLVARYWKSKFSGVDQSTKA